MDITDVEKSEMHSIVDVIEYKPNAVTIRTILKKITGNITFFAFNAGEEFTEKNSPFDKYIQIIDGAAELVIKDRKYMIKSGDGIIIPANSAHSFKATVQFKMISTIIKSGYED